MRKKLNVEMSPNKRSGLKILFLMFKERVRALVLTNFCPKTVSAGAVFPQKSFNLNVKVSNFIVRVSIFVVHRHVCYLENQAA